MQAVYVCGAGFGQSAGQAVCVHTLQLRAVPFRASGNADSQLVVGATDTFLVALHPFRAVTALTTLVVAEPRPDSATLRSCFLADAGAVLSEAEADLGAVVGFVAVMPLRALAARAPAAVVAALRPMELSSTPGDTAAPFFGYLAARRHDVFGHDLVLGVHRRRIPFLPPLSVARGDHEDADCEAQQRSFVHSSLVVVPAVAIVPEWRGELKA